VLNPQGIHALGLPSQAKLLAISRIIRELGRRHSADILPDVRQLSYQGNGVDKKSKNSLPLQRDLLNRKVWCCRDISWLQLLIFCREGHHDIWQ
jgi:hypothetical protein